MKITSVNTQGYYGYLHSAIYGTVNDRYMQSFVNDDDPPEYVNESIGFNPRSLHIRNLARRILLLDFRHRKFLNHLDEILPDDHPVREWLQRLRNCPPAGLFTDPAMDTIYCRKYAVCPWCRFRKALEIAEALDPLRARAKRLAFITLSVPAVFMPLSSSLSQDYAEVIRILCKKRHLFFADHVVTVPVWKATHEEQRDDGGEMQFSFNFHTTLIGLMEENRELPLPENCLSPALRKRLYFGGVGQGTWSVGRPTKKMLVYALQQAMGFSAAQLSIRRDPDEYGTAITVQSTFRAVGHGAARQRSN